MTFLCRTCGQHPIPILRTWQEEIDRGLKAFHNIYTTESQSFQLIADGIVAYIKTLKEEQQVATKALESALRLCSPISRVPDDILIDIFQHLFSSSFKNCKQVHTSNIQPFTLVCKRWRAIITSVPQFWTNISIPPIRGTLPSVTSVSHYFSSLFGRSGILPLKIISSPLPISMLSILEPRTLNRIVYLHVEANFEDTFASCPPLPNLREFSCYKREDWGAPTFDHDDSGIIISLPPFAAPRLTSFSLISSYTLDKIILPFEQLTALKIHSFIADKFDPVPILSQLGRVEKLELNLGVDIANDRVPGRLGITFPHLHTLYLAQPDAYDEFPFLFLQEASFPLLEELNFEVGFGDGCDLLVDTLLSAPGLWSTIVRLGISFDTDAEHCEEDVDILFEAFLKLERVEAFRYFANNDIGMTRQLIQYLTLNEESPLEVCIFPRLELLELTGMRFDGELKVIGDLYDLLVSRGETWYAELSEGVAGSLRVLKEVFLTERIQRSDKNIRASQFEGISIFTDSNKIRKALIAGPISRQ